MDNENGKEEGVTSAIAEEATGEARAEGPIEQDRPHLRSIFETDMVGNGQIVISPNSGEVRRRVVKWLGKEKMEEVTQDGKKKKNHPFRYKEVAHHFSAQSKGGDNSALTPYTKMAVRSGT